MAAKEVEISSTLEAGIKESTHVSFLCQHCYQPLKIDASIYSLDHDTLQELETPFPTLTTANSTQENKTAIDDDLTDSTELVDKIPPASIGNGFDLLGEASSGVKSDNLSHRVKVSAQLFDILSGNTDIDHPLCEECTNQLLNRLDVQLHIAESELESYQDLLASMNLENDTSTQDLEEELKSLKREEESLMKELEMVEQQQKQIDQEKEEMLKQKERLTIEENRYWREYCIHQQNLLDFEDSHNSVVNQLQYAQNQLDKLRKTNVFNSTFLIWHKGHFGTINNLRLGRLPMVPVEWTEINAAWGQTVLLLYSLAKKIGMTFKRYQLVPYGNHSFVECLDDKSKELPLYGSGGFRFFWDTKFDQAMVAFLDCLQQFKEEVEKGDSNFNLPYRMEKGKIYDSTGNGAFSIKIQFNSEEHWTKALKFMLTNLKWGLAWVSSQFANNQSK